MSARFSLAIDLGTSNSAIAIADLESGETRIIEIAQTLGPNQIGEIPTLPSAIYIPHSEEFPESSFPLPWNDAGERAIIGQFARERGALVLIASRPPPILAVQPPCRPEAADPALGIRQSRKRSFAIRMLTPLPPTSQGRIPHSERAQGRDVTFRRRDRVTVPARSMRSPKKPHRRGRKAAGLGDVTLLEEPQAAFYAWMAQTRTEWRT